MRYLKSYKIFESDDADTMARYQLFEAEISKFVREEIMKMSLDEVIESLNLNIKNKIDWKWKE